MQPDAHSEDPNDASETVGRRLRDRHFFSGSINDIGENARAAEAWFDAIGTSSGTSGHILTWSRGLAAERVPKHNVHNPPA